MRAYTLTVHFHFSQVWIENLWNWSLLKSLRTMNNFIQSIEVSIEQHYMLSLNLFLSCIKHTDRNIFVNKKGWTILRYKVKLMLQFDIKKKKIKLVNGSQKEDLNHKPQTLSRVETVDIIAPKMEKYD